MPSAFNNFLPRLEAFSKELKEKYEPSKANAPLRPLKTRIKNSCNMPDKRMPVRSLHENPCFLGS